MVDTGLAVTVPPVVALNPADGDHVKFVPPAALAVSVALPPKQIAGLLGVTETLGNGFTITVMSSELLHPLPSVTETV